MIKDNIDYEILLADHPYDKSKIDELVDIMVEIYVTEKPTIRISRGEVPAALVKAQIQKINSVKIEYVLNCLEQNTSNVRNVKQYLITTLYNSTLTENLHIQSQVNHDLYNRG